MEKALALSTFFPCSSFRGLVDSRFLQTLNSKFSKFSLPAGTPAQQRCFRSLFLHAKKNAFVVEKYVGQLGEKSHRIIARIDGTVIFGRECSRERVWGRCFSFFWATVPEEERDGKKQRTHFLAVAIFEIFTMRCGSPGVVVIVSRTREQEESERVSLSPFAIASRSSRIKTDASSLSSR
jgi:hypothetical protein